MEGVESPVVGDAVLFPYDDRRLSHGQKGHVHEQTCHPTVAVGKGMDVDDARVKIGGNGERVVLVAHRVVDLVQQLPHLRRYLCGRCPDSMHAHNIFADLVGTGTLPLFPAMLVVGALRQKSVGAQDGRLVKQQPGHG